jgi:hypothetical protein
MTLALAGLILLASTGIAEERSWNLEDVTAIVEPQSSVGRVLFRADLDLPEEHVAIRRAVVRVPIGSVEVSRGMTLRIHPVTAQWARGAVGWTNGWSRPGGDFEDLVHGRAELVRGRGQEELRFDITVLAKEILEHGVPNRGFILTIDPGQGLGLPGEDLNRLGVLNGATLELQYRAVPPPPRMARSS